MDVYVANLSLDLNDEDLRNHFKSCGEIYKCTITRDPNTGQSRGFGFVGFVSRDAVELAISSLNDTLLGNQRIRVSSARSNFTERTSRQPARGGFNSRGWGQHGTPYGSHANLPQNSYGQGSSGRNYDQGYPQPYGAPSNVRFIVCVQFCSHSHPTYFTLIIVTLICTIFVIVPNLPNTSRKTNSTIHQLLDTSFMTTHAMTTHHMTTHLFCCCLSHPFHFPCANNILSSNVGVIRTILIYNTAVFFIFVPQKNIILSSSCSSLGRGSICLICGSWRGMSFEGLGAGREQGAITSFSFSFAGGSNPDSTDKSNFNFLLRERGAGESL